MSEQIKFISKKDLIIWDFDGVIKDSIHAKGHAFGSLFGEKSSAIYNKVLSHHFKNGGISRFDKIKIYLTWAGLSNREETIRQYSKKFSDAVVNEVINSPWIEGIEKYLHKCYENQTLALVSATPKDELVNILLKLDIHKYFKFIFGYPTTKEDAYKKIIINTGIEKSDIISIGDSISDYNSSISVGIDFILRIDELKEEIPSWYNGKTISNFICEQN